MVHKQLAKLTIKKSTSVCTRNLSSVSLVSYRKLPFRLLQQFFALIPPLFYKEIIDILSSSSGIQNELMLNALPDLSFYGLNCEHL